MQPKLFVSFLFSFFVLHSAAQFQKGTKMVGASVATALAGAETMDYSGPNTLHSTSNHTRFSLEMSPTIGWFLNDHFAVGAALLVNHSSLKIRRSVGGVTDKKDNTSYTDAGVGAFARYYLTIASSVKPFLHAYVNGGAGSMRFDGIYYTNGIGGTDKSSYDGKSDGRIFYNAGLNGGITKMFSPAVGLDIFIGYGYSHTKTTMKTTQMMDYGNPMIADTKSEYEEDQVFSRHAMNIGIGFQVFLNKK